MEKREGGISGKVGTGEPASGNSEGDRSAIWERWTGSQHERRDGPNSKSSSTVCDQEGSDSRSSFIQGSLGCPRGWNGRGEGI